MLIDEILSRKGGDVPTIEGTKTVADAVSILAKHKIGAVLVIDSEFGTIGIFTERDVVKALDFWGADMLTKPVSNAMTINPTTCVTTDSVEKVLKRMAEGRFRHMPVVEKGHLLGMVTTRDLIADCLMKADVAPETVTAYLAGA